MKAKSVHSTLLSPALGLADLYAARRKREGKNSWECITSVWYSTKAVSDEGCESARRFHAAMRYSSRTKPRAVRFHRERATSTSGVNCKARNHKRELDQSSYRLAAALTEATISPTTIFSQASSHIVKLCAPCFCYTTTASAAKRRLTQKGGQTTGIIRRCSRVCGFHYTALAFRAEQCDNYGTSLVYA